MTEYEFKKQQVNGVSDLSASGLKKQQERPLYLTHRLGVLAPSKIQTRPQSIKQKTGSILWKVIHISIVQNVGYNFFFLWMHFFTFFEAS
jgi:hypothetical protein